MGGRLLHIFKVDFDPQQVPVFKPDIDELLLKLERLDAEDPALYLSLASIDNLFLFDDVFIVLVLLLDFADTQVSIGSAEDNEGLVRSVSADALDGRVAVTLLLLDDMPAFPEINLAVTTSSDDQIIKHEGHALEFNSLPFLRVHWILA